MDQDQTAPLGALSHKMFYQSKAYTNREILAHFEDLIEPRVYVRRITRSTMYEKAPDC